MDYTELKIEIAPYSAEIAEILTAELAYAGFESFVEINNGFQAYIKSNDFKPAEIEKFLKTSRFVGYTITFSHIEISAQNWNAVWESNFEPISIGNQLLVKAPFHNVAGEFLHCITIEPKMSFGTGHHATTSLLLELMPEYVFKNKTVLDMGCGTGILAIYARLLGANNITAIDIDDWACENCIENIERNQCTQIKVIKGDAQLIPQKKYNIILANINRNVLLNDLSIYSKLLSNNGLLFLSGFFKTDFNDINNKAIENNLILQNQRSIKEWIACIYQFTND